MCYYRSRLVAFETFDLSQGYVHNGAILGPPCTSCSSRDVTLMLEHFSLLFELLMYGTVSQLTTLTSHHFVLLNEHLKFQKFSGGDTTGPHSHCGSWRLAASCRTHPISPVSAVRGESAPGAGTQNVMLGSSLRWQPYYGLNLNLKLLKILFRTMS